MKRFFEIKYLELIWYNKDTVTKITESLSALDIEYDDCQNIFKSETTIYPKIKDVKKGILAIRFLNKRTNKPYIEMSNGNIKYLTPIFDPDTHITWWIVKDKWDEEQKQWTSIAPNIVGILTFVLQGHRCELTINGSDFTLKQLEQYLSTFKNDLWELILDENSPAKVGGKENRVMGIDESIIECINSLVSNSIKILETPKVELREIQELKPRKLVKPINRTFMELVTKTNQRLLTSRSSAPSYNTSENSYILFVLERCYCIVKQIIILSENKKNRFQRTIGKLQTQYDNFIDYIKIDRNLVVSDLNKIKERINIDYWRRELNEKLSKSEIITHSSFQNERTIYLMLENYTLSQEKQEKNGFFIRTWNGQEWTKPNNKVGILSLNLIDRFHELVNILEPGMVLKFTGIFNTNETDNSIRFTFREITSIELWDYPTKIRKAKDTFNKEVEKGKQLSGNNWTRPLSLQEKSEQEREKIALQNRIKFYTKHQESCNFIFNKVKPKFLILKELIIKFKAMNIKPSSHFPNSMTFVQNPHYQSVHNNYKKIREIINLQDDDILISLEELERISLVNMPLIYERWVLIQIIFLLKNTFRFTLKENWKYKLINAIKDNQKNIQFYLSNEQAKRNIVLSYEKELNNGKRPDFTLDLTWSPKDSDVTQSKKFILDAKFYDKFTFQRSGGMISKIEELYTNKNYSENGKNPVFLIHPCGNLIDSPVTAQSWGKYSFLGEIDILNNGDYPAHNKGAIYLSPIDNILYNDELQRLLGLFLQYKLENEDASNQDTDITTAIPICIRCGSNHFEIKQKSGERTVRSVWLQCIECEQWQVYNHCVNKRHRLIKNGAYWSYHSARALEPFNIKCPHCGGWGGW